jgi:DNA polymerase III sliding clamp (beta) subunit (PCNA family)
MTSFTIQQKELKRIAMRLAQASKNCLMLLSVQKVGTQALVVAQARIENKRCDAAATMYYGASNLDGIGASCIVNSAELNRLVGKLSGSVTVTMWNDSVTLDDGCSCKSIDSSNEMWALNAMPVATRGIFLLDMPGDEAIDMIDSTIMAAGRPNHGRLRLEKMHLEIGSDTVYAACADGFRLATWGTRPNDATCIGVQVEAMQMLRKLLTPRSHLIISLRDDILVMHAGCDDITVKIDHSDYFDTSPVVAKASDLKHQISVDADDLMRVLKSIIPYAQKCANTLRFSSELSIMHLSSRGSDIKNIKCKTFGENFPEVALNITFLMDIVKRMKGQKITIASSGPASMLVVWSDGDNARHYIMPMHTW